jgi:hypothetical protein
VTIRRARFSLRWTNNVASNFIHPILPDRSIAPQSTLTLAASIIGHQLPQFKGGDAE